MLEFGTKTRVRIAPSFWVLGLMVGYSYTHSIVSVVGYVTALFVVVLLHEYVKAGACRRFGQNVAIELNMYGGMVQCSSESSGSELDGSKSRKFRPTISTRQELGMQCMGLLANIVLFTILLASFTQGMLSSKFWAILFIVNTLWIELNLLPLHPFVGGKVVAAILIWLTPKYGTRLSHLLSAGTAFFLGFAFFSIGLWLLGSLFLLLMWSSIQSYIVARDFGSDTEYLFALKEIEALVELSKYEMAIERILTLKKQVLPKKYLEHLYALHAKVLLLEDNPRHAFEVIQEAEGERSCDIGYELLAHKQLAAYKTSHFQESFDAGQKAFRKKPELATALLLAFTAGRLGDTAAVIAWLLAAQALGFSDFQSLEPLSDFDPVRHEPEIQGFFSKN